MKNSAVAWLGKTLKAMREARNLKQEDVAREAGITRPMLSAYERGRVLPLFVTLDRLMMAMGADYADLQKYRNYVGPQHPDYRRADPVPPPERREVVEEEIPPEQAMEAVFKALEAWLNTSLRAHQANQQILPQTPQESPEGT